MAGGGRRRCDAGFPCRRSKPLRLGVPAARRGPLTAGAGARIRGRPSNAKALNGRLVAMLVRVDASERSTAGDDAEQTSNIARGTPETWRTCGTIDSTSLDVARRRGTVGPLGPWRSARPRFFSGSGGLPAEARKGEGGMAYQTTAYPAPPTIRAATLAYSSFRGAPKAQTRNPEKQARRIALDSGSGANAPSRNDEVSWLFDN